MYSEKYIEHYTSAMTYCDEISQMIAKVCMSKDPSFSASGRDDAIGSIIYNIQWLSSRFTGSIPTLQDMFNDFIEQNITIGSLNINDLRIANALDIDTQMIISQEEHPLYDLDKIVEYYNSLQEDFHIVKDEEQITLKYNKDDFFITDLKEYTVSSVIKNHCITYVDSMNRVRGLNIFGFLQMAIDETLLPCIHIVKDFYSERDYEFWDEPNYTPEEKHVHTAYHIILNISEFIRFVCKFMFTTINIIEAHTDTCEYAINQQMNKRFTAI